ncbi:hypothetical protein HY029_05645 [Candidatus Gottesmanbacteria bacterium]|nr:hypothetical protein [Candidatus Gottesmanbacteria bacterium]
MGLVKNVYAVNITDEWPLAKVFPDLGSIPSRLLPMALLFGGIIFFVMVIVAGFSIMKGAGSEDAQAKEKWHRVLTYGAVGLMIMFSSYWILQIINFVTNHSLDSIL